MKIGKKEFDTSSNCYVMGILNITPDSFSDGGRYNTLDRALFHVEEMLGEGMDIVDIGGESTRPGYKPLSEEEETARVAEVIEAVKLRFDVPISLDTYKASVAAAGIEAGADMINDIWGLKYDPLMGKVIAEAGVACCLMHNRKLAEYYNFMEDVASDIAEILHLADQAGIPDDKIILDPGVGFAKNLEQNLEIIANLDKLRVFDHPILLGTSRKSVIGLTLDLPVDERTEGTVTTTVTGVMQGCSFVRVHEVKENVRAIKMTKAIMRYR